MSSFTNPNVDVLRFDGRLFEFGTVVHASSAQSHVEMTVCVQGKPLVTFWENHENPERAKERVEEIRKMMNRYYERKGGLPMTTTT